MSHEDVNFIGAAGEAAVAAELAAAGFHVFTPAFGSPKIDMIAERDGRLIRLQVKTLAGDAKALRFCTWGANYGSGYSGEVDWLALHSLHYGVTAFLKPDEAGAYPTIRYDTEDTTARQARDYSIERLTKEAEN